MEASDLVHEESSHIAKLLAGRAVADGKNVIWDITMASKSTTEQRLDDLAEAGYVTIGIFVDIPVEESILRADYRHRAGHEGHRNDSGYGGRYVPPEVMRSQADPDWGCVNRRTFEQIKYRFSGWAIYDNSVHGREPLLVASSGDPESRSKERYVSEVTDLIGRYKAGELTLDELTQRFRTRRWPRTVPPPPSSYLEMAARSQEDPRSDVPDSYDEVTTAYARRELTRRGV